MESCDEAIQLSMTVALAYFQRGDSGHAIRMCRKAIVKAEELDSPVARASAYWNASVFEAERGSVSNAVPLAERALMLLGEGQDTRNLARLRTSLGTMQLELDPPEVSEALRHLEKASEELVWSSASPKDMAQNDLAIARARYLEGDLMAAHDLCHEIIASVGETAPIMAADAEALAGQVAAAGGDVDAASVAYRRAVFRLTAVGADRDAAQLWFELADLLEDVGDVEAARDAYRSAASASGLRTRTKVRTETYQLLGAEKSATTLDHHAAWLTWSCPRCPQWPARRPPLRALPRWRWRWRRSSSWSDEACQILPVWCRSRAPGEAWSMPWQIWKS